MRKILLLLAMVLLTGAAKAQEAYAVLNDGTLTFYYDTQRASRAGRVYQAYAFDFSGRDNAWRGLSSAITTVVFDSSFAAYDGVTSTSYWFYGCKYLTGITGLTNLNTANVTDMSWMFCGCSSLTSLDVSNFNTSNVADMMQMFTNCRGLTSLDVSSFNTSNVAYMRCMFLGCSGLASLDLSSFDTSNVTDMRDMFSGCSGLTSLDVSGFNTSKVTNMSWMFCNCSSLTSLGVSNFNTSSVNDMGYMFSGCSGLTSLDVSSFDTSNVAVMLCMFYECSGLTSLDLRNFDTSNVEIKDYMFFGCSGLTDIYCNDTWNPTSSTSSSSYMFYGCTSLFAYDMNHMHGNYAHPNADGYFTRKVGDDVTEPVRLVAGNEVDGTYWSTFYFSKAGAVADENTTVYTAKLSSDNQRLTLTEVTDKVIPANNAVVLKSTDSSVTLTRNGATGTLANNSLKGTDVYIVASSVSGTVYTLVDEDEGLGFYRYTGVTLADRMAYLAVTGDAPRALLFGEGAPTGMGTELGAGTDAMSTWYTPAGVKLERRPTTKGLYIVDGRKVVVNQ